MNERLSQVAGLGSLKHFLIFNRDRRLWGTSYRKGQVTGLDSVVKILDLIAYQNYSMFRFSCFKLLTN